MMADVLTVCKSLRNKINVTKPAPIPIGARLIQASSWPNRSPEMKHDYDMRISDPSFHIFAQVNFILNEFELIVTK